MAACALPIRSWPRTAWCRRETASTDTAGAAALKNPGLYHPFAPRFGFAWQPFGSDKTVVRGGYGIFYGSPKGREIDDSGDIYPFEVRSSFIPQTQPTSPKLTNDRFPVFTTIAPVTPQDITFLAVIQGENPHDPYVQQWSMDVQRQLAQNTVVDVGYSGSKGTHLLTRTDISQAYPPADSSFCSAQDANGNFINIHSGDCPVATRRPYPNFTGTFIDSEFQGVSNYDALNVNLTHRSGSLVTQLSYAWSHSLDDKSAAAGVGDSRQGYQGFLNKHDPKLDWATSDFDVNQRFVGNFVYELPFGRGRRFGSSANKLVDGVLGDWRVGGILTLQKGFPFTIYASDPFGLLDNVAGYNRANQIAPPGITGNINEYFNTAAFAQPLPAHFVKAFPAIWTRRQVRLKVRPGRRREGSFEILRNYSFTILASHEIECHQAGLAASHRSNAATPLSTFAARGAAECAGLPG